MAIQGVPTSRYRFLLTVARRAGIDDIRIHAIVGSSKTIDIKLPCGIDGCDVESYITDAFANHGFRNAFISEYLGSKIVVKDSHPICFFRFKACIDGTAAAVAKKKY